MHTLMETIGNLPAKLGGSSQTPPFQSSESFEHPTYWASSEKKALTASVFTELALYAECPEGALDLKAVFEMIQRASRKVATILQTSASCSVRHRQQPEAPQKKFPPFLRVANAPRPRDGAGRRGHGWEERVVGRCRFYHGNYQTASVVLTDYFVEHFALVPPRTLGRTGRNASSRCREWPRSARAARRSFGRSTAPRATEMRDLGR